MALESSKGLYSDSSPAVVFSLATPDFLGQSFTRITTGAGRWYLHQHLLWLLGDRARGLLALFVSSLSTARMVKPFSAPEVGPGVRAHLSYG